MERALEAYAHCSTESQIRELLDNLTERGRGRLVSHGHIAIQRVIESDNPDVLRALLQQPEVQINQPLATTQNGNTLLHIGVRDKQVTRMILDRVDLDPNLGNCRGETPLHLAASGCPDILNLLISDPRSNIAALTFHMESALHFACKVASKGQALEAVRKLLEHAEMNARISTSEFIEQPNIFGKTPLHFAAENDLAEAMSELLSKLEPRRRQLFALAQDNERRTALNVAASSGSLEAVHCLLPFGDRVTPSTAAHSGVRSGRADIVRACLTSSWCGLPETTGLQEVIRFFLELFTIATHYSVAMCLEESLYEFLTLNPVADKKEYPSLFHWAIKVDDAHSLIDYILRWDPEMANATLDEDTQQTPLHVATLLGNERAVEALCREGAPWSLNGNARDVYNNTALDYAFESMNEPIQRILRKRKEIQEEMSRLHTHRVLYVNSANALLVVSTLLASLTFVKCLTPQGVADEKRASAGESLQLRIVYTVVSTRMAFLLAVTATFLAAFAALPFSFGFFFTQTVDDHIVRRSMLRTRLLIVMSSYCLAWSLFSVFFMFVCAVYIAPWINFRCEVICEVVVGLFIFLSVVIMAANLVRLWSKSKKRMKLGRGPSWRHARFTPLDGV